MKIFHLSFIIFHLKKFQQTIRYTLFPIRCQRGQTIIEVLVALAVATTIVSAITVSVITALTNVQYSRTQNEATHIAQQSIDLVRQKRDANFTQFSTDYAVDAATGSNKIYCLGKGVDEFPAKESARLENDGCASLYDNKYIRYIKLEKGASARNCALTGTPIPADAPGGEAIKLTSVVKWADAKCVGNERCHKVELVTCLYNILQIIDVTNTPTPTITPTPTPVPTNTPIPTPTPPSPIPTNGTNLMIASTYNGTNWNGWGTYNSDGYWQSVWPGGISTQSTIRGNGFNGDALRITNTVASHVAWAVSGAQTQQFLANHTYRISFRYRTNVGVYLNNRDDRITTIPIQTGSAQVFTYNYIAPLSTNGASCSLGGSCFLLFGLMGAANPGYFEVGELFIADITQ